MKLLASRTTDKASPWMIWRWWEILKGSDLYMTRLYLLNTPWFGIKLHWIARPDADRDCHDHPWWFVSWVLRGGYEERRQWYGETGLRDLSSLGTRKRWSWCFRSSTDIHQITKVEPRTLTFIINGPKCRGWGFWVPESGAWSKHRFVPWRTYLNLPANTPEV